MVFVRFLSFPNCLCQICIVLELCCVDFHCFGMAVCLISIVFEWFFLFDSHYVFPLFLNGLFLLTSIVFEWLLVDFHCLCMLFVIFVVFEWFCLICIAFERFVFDFHCFDWARWIFIVLECVLVDFHCFPMIVS